MLIGANGGSRIEYVQKAVDIIISKIKSTKSAKEISSALQAIFLKSELGSMYSQTVISGSIDQLSSSLEEKSKSNLEKLTTAYYEGKVLTPKLKKNINKFAEYLFSSGKGAELYKILKQANRHERYKLIVNGEEYNEESYNPESSEKLHAEVSVIDCLLSKLSSEHKEKTFYIGNNKKACPSCDISMHIYKEDEEKPFDIKWRGKHDDFTGVGKYDFSKEEDLYYKTSKLIKDRLAFLEKLRSAYAKKDPNKNHHEPTDSSSSVSKLAGELGSIQESIRSAKLSHQSTKNWNKYDENIILAGKLIAAMKKMKDKEGNLLFEGFNVVLVREGQEFDKTQKNTIGISISQDDRVQIYLGDILQRTITMQTIPDLKLIFQDLDLRTPQNIISKSDNC